MYDIENYCIIKKFISEIGKREVVVRHFGKLWKMTDNRLKKKQFLRLLRIAVKNWIRISPSVTAAPWKNAADFLCGNSSENAFVSSDSFQTPE